MVVDQTGFEMWEEVARNPAATWENIEGEAAMWEACGTLTAGGRAESLQAAVEGGRLVCLRSLLPSESFVHVEDIEGKYYIPIGEFVVVDFG